jgi:carbon-monoxide dehydrogenase medium subunit
MRYESPATIDEAVSLLAAEAGKARVLAGGTDLLVQMRTGRLEPSLVVDIKRVPGLLDIREGAGGYRIGAALVSREGIACQRACFVAGSRW